MDRLHDIGTEHDMDLVGLAKVNMSVRLCRAATPAFIWMELEGFVPVG